MDFGQTVWQRVVQLIEDVRIFHSVVEVALGPIGDGEPC